MSKDLTYRGTVGDVVDGDGLAIYSDAPEDPAPEYRIPPPPTDRNRSES